MDDREIMLAIQRLPRPSRRICHKHNAIRIAKAVICYCLEVRRQEIEIRLPRLALAYVPQCGHPRGFRGCDGPEGLQRVGIDDLRTTFANCASEIGSRSLKCI